MPDWNLLPEEIEARSWAIIEAEAPPHDWDAQAWRVIRRMVHTTADFDWVTNTIIHPQALAQGMAAIRAGRPIFTDTRMAQAGISPRRLTPYGCQVHCLMADAEVAKLAQSQGTTRAVAAVDLALERLAGGIYVVGNAPTALYRLLEHLAQGKPGPALVVGLPVGFVNAAEAKDALASSGQISITARGRKGGSAVAASVVNALAELCAEC